MQDTMIDKRLMIVDGRRLKALRTERGLSHRSLANAVGMVQSSISRLENEQGNTDVENVKKIAQVLSVNFDDLIKKHTLIDEKSPYRHPLKEWSTLRAMIDASAPKYHPTKNLSAQCFRLRLKDNLHADFKLRRFLSGQEVLVDPTLQHWNNAFVITLETDELYMRKYTKESTSEWLAFSNELEAAEQGIIPCIQMTQDCQIIGVVRKLLIDLDLLP